MKGIIELVSINDISNIVESKLCGQSLNYYIKNQDVYKDDCLYRMIVKMDIECKPESIFYTKSIELEELEEQAVITKGHKARKQNEYKYAKDIIQNQVVKNELKSKIHNVCIKLM